MPAPPSVIQFPVVMAAQEWDWGWLYVDNQLVQKPDEAVPLLDLCVHTLQGECWCRPAVDEAGVIVHNSADGRERYERGQARMH